MNASEILALPTEPFAAATISPQSEYNLDDELIAEKAGITAQAIEELQYQRFDGYCRWGLNE